MVHILKNVSCVVPSPIENNMQLTVYPQLLEILLSHSHIFFFAGELNLIEIDQYSFSPGPHTLLISFNLTTGEEGSFQHNFTGVVRQRKLNLEMFYSTN